MMIGEFYCARCSRRSIETYYLITSLLGLRADAERMM
jgi:hypothetical protein